MMGAMGTSTKTVTTATTVSAADDGGDDDDNDDDERLYRGHWSRVYAKDATQHDREWHCSTDDALPFITPYVAHAAASAAPPARGGGGGLVVDVGCGSSSMGHDLWRRFHFQHLLMTDIDDGIIDVMRRRFGTDSAAAGKKEEGRCQSRDTDTGSNAITTTTRDATGVDYGAGGDDGIHLGRAARDNDDDDDDDDGDSGEGGVGGRRQGAGEGEGEGECGGGDGARGERRRLTEEEERWVRCEVAAGVVSTHSRIALALQSSKAFQSRGIHTTYACYVHSDIGGAER